MAKLARGGWRSMDPRDARLVLQEARAWTRRGLLPQASLDVLEGEYAPRAAAKDGEPAGIGLAVLYALAGALLGAACVAVPILLDAQEAVIGWWLLALGLPLLVGGVVLWRTGGPFGIVDALLVGSLVPLTFMGAPDETLGKFLAPVGLLAAVLVTWLPRASPTVPVVGSVATYACAGILSYQWFRETGFIFDDVGARGAWLWMTLAALQLAATLTFGRASKASWRTPVAALLCIGLVIPFVMVMDDLFPSQDSHFYELMVGLLELGLVGLGLLLRERGLILGGAIVVAGDAIVFAFDVDVLFGIVVLVAVAFALVALATWLKRRGRPLPPETAPERT